MNLEDVLDDAESCSNLVVMRLNNEPDLHPLEVVAICQALMGVMESSKLVPASSLKAVTVFVREAKILLDDLQSITERLHNS